MWLEGIALEKFLIRIRILNQAQGHALILIHITYHTYTATKKRMTDKVQVNRTEKRSLGILRNFNQKELGTIWHDSDIFSFSLEQTNLTKIETI